VTPVLAPHRLFSNIIPFDLIVCWDSQDYETVLFLEMYFQVGCISCKLRQLISIQASSEPLVYAGRLLIPQFSPLKLTWYLPITACVSRISVVACTAVMSDRLLEEIHWLLSQELTGWLIPYLTALIFGWLAEYLTNRLVHWLIDWLTVSLHTSLTSSMTDSLSG
jgi:hypothetical protein